MIQVDSGRAQSPVDEVPVHKIGAEHEIPGDLSLHTYIDVLRRPSGNIGGIQSAGRLLDDLNSLRWRYA